MIKQGDRIPEATFPVMGDDGMEHVTTDSLFKGKKVVLFGVPGAFTPTCHQNHLPGYLDNIDGLKALGVDDVAVVSVNDVFVMESWAKDTGGKGKLIYLADGSGDFAKAMGLEIDLSEHGLGIRNLRYSLIAQDGVVTHFNLEENPGIAEKSGAAVIIEQLKA
ncbi:MAG: peroxiredoxin [Cohaesibacter sp.]|nr:peroxiredoxin [Cohaesibacter sp.]MCV6601758.1 peroxiredoxin [Cohaesibacter sp.]